MVQPPRALVGAQDCIASLRWNSKWWVWMVLPIQLLQVPRFWSSKWFSYLIQILPFPTGTWSKWWFQRFFLFSPLHEEMIQFDKSFFFNWVVQPPTSDHLNFVVVEWTCCRWRLSCRFTYCWWFRNPKQPVDMVKYPMKYKVWYIQTVVGLGISEPSTVIKSIFSPREKHNQPTETCRIQGHKMYFVAELVRRKQAGGSMEGGSWWLLFIYRNYCSECYTNTWEKYGKCANPMYVDFC